MTSPDDETAPSSVDPEAVAAVLRAQVDAGGGYAEDGDGEELPAVVFRPGWSA
jgi:hypothetical protein